MDFSNYKFRCSGLAPFTTQRGLTTKQASTLEDLNKKAILTAKQLQTKEDLEKKRDDNSLTKGELSYLQNIHREVVLGRSEEIKSKYLEKGILVEEKSISLYSKVTGDFVVKHVERLTNEYVTGLPDITTGGVKDIKSSWSFSTFPMHDQEITNKGYIAQLNGYMWLTDTSESKLIYCLVDTPLNIINDELRRLDWQLNIFNLSGSVKEEFISLVVETVQNHIYTIEGLEEFCVQSEVVKIEWFENFLGILPEHRIKIFECKRDDNLINQIKNQIKKGREYLNNLSINMFGQREEKQMS